MSNPYAPSDLREPKSSVALQPKDPWRQRLLTSVVIGIQVLGWSMLAATCCVPLILHGEWNIFPIDDSGHVASFLVALSTACLACFAVVIGTRWWSRLAIFLVPIAIAVTYLAVVEWPIAVYPLFFDISNLYAVFVVVCALAALPLVSTVPQTSRLWIAVIPYCAVALIAIYVLARDRA